MQVLGNKVYLELPDMDKPNISIPEQLQEELKKKNASKLAKLKVFAVGMDVKHVEVGDEVMVDPAALYRASFFQIEKKELVSVPAFEIMHIW